MAAALFPAVRRLWVKTCVALAADLFIPIVALCKRQQVGFNEPSAQAQHQVESRLLLDVVVGQRAAVLQLLASENQALLVRRNPLLVLDLCLHILDRV